MDRLIRDQETTNTLMTEFDSLMAEGAVPRPGQRRPRRHRHHPPAVRRRPVPRPGRPGPQPLRPRPLGRDVRLRHRRLLRPVDPVRPAQGIPGDADLGRRRPLGRSPSPTPGPSSTPSGPPGRPSPSGGSTATATPTTSSTATRRPRRSSAKLNERISMNFPNETPLEDVKKYIEQSTQDEAAGLPTGIPIYVDPRRPPGRRQDDGLDGDDRPRRHPAQDDPPAAAQAARPDLHRQGRPADDHLRLRPKTSRPRSASTRSPTSPSSRSP